MKFLICCLLPYAIKLAGKIFKHGFRFVASGFVMYILLSGFWQSDNMVEYRKKYYTIDTPPEVVAQGFLKEIPGMIDDIKPELQNYRDSLITGVSNSF